MKPLFKPYMPEGITGELEKILYSDSLSYGKYGRQFEAKLSGYLNSDLSLTTGTYNHAMLIAIASLNLKPGDEVIASPISCLASNQPFATFSLKIKWVDVNPYTGGICTDDLKKKITNKTKAIFVNHFCGYLADIINIQKIAKQWGIVVVQDCIEAFGSRLDGKLINSTYSDISVFSFQTVRIPNTIEGGALTFSNSEFYERAKKIRDYGIDRTTFRDENGEISADCDIVDNGFGGTMNEISSFIGIKQLEEVDTLLALQKSNAAKWKVEMSELDEMTSLELNPNSEPNYWVYGILSENKQKSLKDFRNQGWYASTVHINNNIYSIFGDKRILPGVNQFIEKFLAVPCGWWIKK